MVRFRLTPLPRMKMRQMAGIHFECAAMLGNVGRQMLGKKLPDFGGQLRAVSVTLWLLR